MKLICHRQVANCFGVVIGLVGLVGCGSTHNTDSMHGDYIRSVMPTDASGGRHARSLKVTPDDLAYGQATPNGFAAKYEVIASNRDRFTVRLTKERTRLEIAVNQHGLVITALDAIDPAGENNLVQGFLGTWVKAESIGEASDKSKSDAVVWTRVRVSGTKIGVDMPEEPSVKKDGEVVTYYCGVGSETIFQLVVTSLETGTATRPSQHLDQLRDSLVDEFMATDVEEKLINLDGHPGRDLTLKYARDSGYERVLRQQGYVANGRLVALQIIGAHDADPADIQRCFGSLTLGE